MRTTITLEADVFEDLMRLTKARTKTEAVNRAVAEWVRRQRIQQLRGLRGQLEFDGEVEDFRSLSVQEVEDDFGT